MPVSLQAIGSGARVKKQVTAHHRQYSKSWPMRQVPNLGSFWPKGFLSLVVDQSGVELSRSELCLWLGRILVFDRIVRTFGGGSVGDVKNR